MQNYIQAHIQQGLYTNPRPFPGGCRYFNHLMGWDDYHLGKHVMYSYRSAYYADGALPNILHAHRHYEVVLYLGGESRYVSDDQVLLPQPGDVIVIPSDKSHATRLLNVGVYNRHVLYFTPDVFNFLGPDMSPPEALLSQFRCLRILPEYKERFAGLFNQLHSTLSGNRPDAGLQGFSLFMQLLLMLANHSVPSQETMDKTPSNVQLIKQYIDENYRTLGTATEVAQHFFYSREYVHRLFKQWYGISPAEYLTRQKIACARELLAQGRSVSHAFTESGYQSMSSFIRAFRQQTGQTPSEYRRQASGKR